MERISFTDVAKALGYEEAGGPGGPGGAPGGAQGGPGAMPKSENGIPQFSPEMSKRSAERMAQMWPKERALKLFDYFKDAAENGSALEFEGHPACWAMMALCAYLKKCDLHMYMPPFQKSLILAPFTIGDKPVNGQMCTFEVEQKGEAVKLSVILGDGGNPDPFKIPFGDTVSPAIAPGKNIYVELVGPHYLVTFSLPWTYPDCKNMYMNMPDGCYCVYSSDGSANVGDIVDFPF